MEFIALLVFLVFVGFCLQYFAEYIHPKMQQLIIFVIVVIVFIVIIGWFGYGPGTHLYIERH